MRWSLVRKGDIPLLLGPSATAALWLALKTGSPGWASEAAAAALCAAAGCLAALAVRELVVGETVPPAAEEQTEKNGENLKKESEGEGMFWRNREEQQKGGAAAPAWAEKVRPAGAGNTETGEAVGEQEQEAAAAAAEPARAGESEERHEQQQEGVLSEHAPAEPPRLTVVQGGCGAPAAGQQAACGCGAGTAAAHQQAHAQGGRAALDLFEAVRSLVESVQLEEKETWAAVRDSGGRAAELAARLEAELEAVLGTCREIRAALDELVRRVSGRA